MLSGFISLENRIKWTDDNVASSYKKTDEDILCPSLFQKGGWLVI